MLLFDYEYDQQCNVPEDCINGAFYNVVYTKEWLQKLSYTKTGFRFFEREDFLQLGKQAGFSEVRIQDIVKGKSFVIIYKK